MNKMIVDEEFFSVKEEEEDGKLRKKRETDKDQGKEKMQEPKD